MSLANPRFGRWFSLSLTFGILLFLVAASGTLPSAVVHADSFPDCSLGGSPCALGPNLEVVSFSGDLFSGGGGGGGGGGCGGAGATVTLDESATDPGFTVTGNAPCTLSGTGSFSKTETFSFAGLNGYELEDLSGSFTCGVTGGDSLSLSFNSLVLTCPTETTVGAVGPAIGPADITFTPVTSLTETITLSGTGVINGSITFTAFSNNISLLAPSAVPEPNALLLLCTVLVGLVGITRKRLLGR